MNVRKIDIKWKCVDGSEWPTEDDAKRHQALLEAVNQFAKAKQMLAVRTAESIKTADGKPFRCGENYFVIVGNHPDYWPKLRMVMTDQWYSTEFEVTASGRLKVKEYGGTVFHDVTELYSDRSAALVELKHRRDDRMKEFAAQVD